MSVKKAREKRVDFWGFVKKIRLLVVVLFYFFGAILLLFCGIVTTTSKTAGKGEGGGEARGYGRDICLSSAGEKPSLNATGDGGKERGSHQRNPNVYRPIGQKPVHERPFGRHHVRVLFPLLQLLLRRRDRGPGVFPRW